MASDAKKRHLLSTRIDVASAKRRRELAARLGLRIAQMDEAMMRHFLRVRPWTEGLQFAIPAAFRLTGEKGWADCKLEISAELIESSRSAAEAAGASIAAFSYSAILWWLGIKHESSKANLAASSPRRSRRL